MRNTSYKQFKKIEKSPKYIDFGLFLGYDLHMLNLLTFVFSYKTFCSFIG